MSVSHSASATHLNATLELLTRGSLTTAAASAPANLDAWIQLLRASGEDAHRTIADDLVELKGHLNNGADPAPISSLLLTLGEHIHSLVDNANPRYIDSLNQLAQALSDAARELQQA